MERGFPNPCRHHGRHRRKQCCKRLGARCLITRSGCRTCRCKRNLMYSNYSKRCAGRQPTTQAYVTTSGSTAFQSTPESWPSPTQTAPSTYITSKTWKTMSSKSDSPLEEITPLSSVSRGSGNSTERPAQTTPRITPRRGNSKSRPPKRKSRSTATPTPTTPRQQSQTTSEATATTGHAGNHPKFGPKIWGQNESLTLCTCFQRSVGR